LQLRRAGLWNPVRHGLARHAAKDYPGCATVYYTTNRLVRETKKQSIDRFLLKDAARQVKSYPIE
jgi:hypothetical protein